MSKNISRHVSTPAQWHLREGEGVALDVRVKHDVAVSGQSVALMEVDIRNAPVPDRRYVADMFAVRAEGRSIRLMFGQRRLNGTELRTLLIIQMSAAAVKQFLLTIDQVKNPTFLEIVQIAGGAVEQSGTVDREPDQTVALSANMVLTAMSGEEAAMDFYKASPFSLHAAPTRGKLALDPVVRVDLPSAIALGAITALRKAADGIGLPTAAGVAP
jgi:hypothetical protein